MRHGHSPSASSASVQRSVKLDCAVAAARDEGDGVAVLDVARRAHGELDRQRRRCGLGVERRDRDPLDDAARARRCACGRRRRRAARAAPPGARRPRARRRRRRRPRPRRSPRAAPTPRSGRRRSARRPARDPSPARAPARRSRGRPARPATRPRARRRRRALGDRLLVQALVVAPRRRHDVRVEVVRALGVLLDRQQAPAARRACRASSTRRAWCPRSTCPFCMMRPPSLVSTYAFRLASMRTVTRSSVSSARLTMPTYSTDGRLVDVDAVVPALAVEVVQPPAPLDHQVVADQLRQPLAVAPVPGAPGSPGTARSPARAPPRRRRRRRRPPPRRRRA